MLSVPSFCPTHHWPTLTIRLVIDQFPSPDAPFPWPIRRTGLSFQNAATPVHPGVPQSVSPKWWSEHKVPWHCPYRCGWFQRVQRAAPLWHAKGKYNVPIRYAHHSYHFLRSSWQDPCWRHPGPVCFFLKLSWSSHPVRRSAILSEIEKRESFHCPFLYICPYYRI